MAEYAFDFERPMRAAEVYRTLKKLMPDADNGTLDEWARKIVDDLFEKMPETRTKRLSKALMDEYDKLNKGSHGSSGSRRYFAADGKSAVMTIGKGMADGTDDVYVIQADLASWRHDDDRLTVTRKGPYVDSKEWFWRKYVADKDSPRVVRVNHTHYCIGEANRSGEMAGFGGRQWKIRFNDGRVEQTKNLWFQGIIPPKFREELPDNAVFEKSDEQIAQEKQHAATMAKLEESGLVFRTTNTND